MKTTAYSLRHAVNLVAHEVRQVRREAKGEPVMFGGVNVHWIEEILIAAKGTLAALERLKQEDGLR